MRGSRESFRGLLPHTARVRIFGATAPHPAAITMYKWGGGVKHRIVKISTMRAQVRSHMTTALGPEEGRSERTGRPKGGIGNA
eukprot:7628384-Pyramimonas_sp.AAC.1